LCTAESKAWQTTGDEEPEALARQLRSLTVPGWPTCCGRTGTTTTAASVLNWTSSNKGACERCGVEITSTAKQAFCPACGDLCWLT
jgi:hypothetical protein